MTRLLLFLLLPAVCHAQDYPQCIYHYSSNGKVSSAICYDNDNRWGWAKAFDASGKVIYEKELRKIAGHSSVTFDYYSNGAVKKAMWSSAPDAGIQWYNATTTFAEDGTITGVQENNYDNHPSIAPATVPYHNTKEQKPAPPSTTVSCAAIYSSEIWVTNTTNMNIIVAGTRNDHEHFEKTIAPGQTAKAETVILAEQFEDPARYYHISARPAHGKKKLIVMPGKLPEQPSKEVKKYFFEVHRII